MSASLHIALAAATLAPGRQSPSLTGAAVSSDGVCARYAPEAASRSGIAADIILRVMYAESRGQVRNVSQKGAMGCMQIMPQTWADLSRRYGLGSDPFDPRMNMLGGALYLAQLARQFGFPGAYSAYNAGPGRYLRYVRAGTPLPAETVAYAEQVAGTATMPARSVSGNRPTEPRWQEAGLFAVQHASSTATNADAIEDRVEVGAPGGLFPLAAVPRHDDGE